MIESAAMYIVIMIISAAAVWGRALSVSGAFASILVGMAIYNGFGIKGLILLGLFFSTSTIWSKFKQNEKKTFENKLEKSGERDFMQVMVNGGAAALMSILFAFSGSPLFEKLFIISLAAANSDTWASEIGTISKGKPYLITTFRQVDRGTSGAVSLLGTLAALFGSFLIAFAAFFLPFSMTIADLLLLTCIGFIGNAADTLLGALVQIAYKCPVCGLETEQMSHCDTKTVPIKGVKYMNNDAVNGLANLVAIVCGIALYM